MAENADASIDTLDAALTKIEDSVDPLLNMDARELAAQVSPIEGAKLNIALSYGLSALYYAFLKTKGISPKDHPVKKELQRVQAYMGKMKAFEAKHDKPKTVIDVPASERMIMGAMSGDKTWTDAEANTQSAARGGAQPKQKRKFERAYDNETGGGDERKHSSKSPGNKFKKKR